ncbi:MAG: sulfotransferase, partial [Phycisphaerales bacterium]|nr:sulfotransferase [Phycisphaerales bacterium]
DPIVHNESCATGFRKAGAFQLGRLYEGLGQFDQSFNAYQLGKALVKPDWDPDAHSARVDRLIECWTDSAIASADIDGSNLVFIVGMMRSGTSLCEQMVSRCEGIVPGDELSIVENTVSMFEGTTEYTLPMTREKYTQEQIQSLASKAFDAYTKHFGDSIGTDKQPENFYHIPLIVRLFPGCKIVHCVRDSMDCCVSNFVQSFAHGHPQTHDLGWLGRYHLDYQRVMDAWKSLPEVSMLEIRYEDLVSEPQTHTKRLAEHIGVPWTEEMLRFHESKRVVKTASREQVRSAINTRSIGRHERFDKHLAPLRSAMGISDS